MGEKAGNLLTPSMLVELLESLDFPIDLRKKQYKLWEGSHAPLERVPLVRQNYPWMMALSKSFIIDGLLISPIFQSQLLHVQDAMLMKTKVMNLGKKWNCPVIPNIAVCPLVGRKRLNQYI